MAHRSQGATIVSRPASVPRGLVIAVLAVTSWALVVAAWNAISLSFAFLLGA